MQDQARIMILEMSGMINMDSDGLEYSHVILNSVKDFKTLHTGEMDYGYTGT